MSNYPGTRLIAPLVLLLLGGNSRAQTPEQQQLWDTQRIQIQAEDRKKAEQLSRERAARRADPMSWVRSLDAMTSGGWEFRAVANDGSWATYSTTHQMKRSGKTVTVWLRQEYAEAQMNNSTPYSSVVEKIQFDCAKEQERPTLVVYYSGNNIQGTEQSEEADLKTAPWNAIVPGTRDEYNYLWACAAGK